MNKYAYKLIKKRLQDKVPDLDVITWDMSQGTEGVKGEVRARNNVYIKFMPTDTSSLGNGIQEGKVIFQVRLLTECLWDDDKRIDDEEEDAFDHMDLVTEIHKALSGYSAKMSDLPAFVSLKDTENDLTVCNTMDRVNISPDNAMSSLMTTTQSFTSLMKDFSGNKKYTKVVRKLEIEDSGFDQP